MTEKEKRPSSFGQGWINRTIGFKEGDLELMEWGMKFLGCSRSDLVRSAVKAYVFHLQAISKSGN